MHVKQNRSLSVHKMVQKWLTVSLILTKTVSKKNLYLKVFFWQHFFASIYHRCIREITGGRSLHRILPCCRQPCGLNWGYLVFCRPHTKKQMQNKCVHDLSVPCSILRMLIFTLGDIGTWRTTVILIKRNT